MLYLLDNTSLCPALNFTYEAKVNALLEAGFVRIEEASKLSSLKDDHDSPLLIGVFGHPFLRQQTPQWTNEVRSLLDRHRNKERVFLWIEDMHDFTYQVIKRCCTWSAQFTKLITYNKCEEAHHFKHGRWVYVPHHVDTSIYYDYGIERDIGVLSYGGLRAQIYPLRLQLYEQYKDTEGFYRIDHPSYNKLTHDIHTHKLAHFLNRSRSVITCASKYGYGLARFFEAACCGTSMIGESCPDIDDIGLIVNSSEPDILLSNREIASQYSIPRFVSKIKEIVEE